MDFLPLEIQSLIINNNYIKCCCLTICKTWEKILKDDPPNNDLITHILDKDYYAIQLNCFNFPNKLKEKEANVAIIMNNSLIFKIILSTIYKRLPDTDSILMYLKIDEENSIIIDNIIHHIIIKGNYLALQYFLKIHYDSGFPYDLTYMSNTTNIIKEIKLLNNFQFEHFMMIDYLMEDAEIEWCEGDLKFINRILSSSFNKFYDFIRSKIKVNKNNAIFIKLINKLINKKNIICIYEGEAYLECVRHGLYNIIKTIPELVTNNLLDSEFTLFLLSLSGNCDLKDIIRFYHVDYFINYHSNRVKDYVNMLNINDRYNELILLRTKAF